MRYPALDGLDALNKSLAVIRGIRLADPGRYLRDLALHTPTLAIARETRALREATIGGAIMSETIGGAVMREQRELSKRYSVGELVGNLDESLDEQVEPSVQEEPRPRRKAGFEF